MDGVNEDDDVTCMISDRNERRTELQRHTTSINTLLADIFISCPNHTK